MSCLRRGDEPLIGGPRFRHFIDEGACWTVSCRYISVILTKKAHPAKAGVANP